MSPYNSLILPVKKPNGKGWRFAQHLIAINKIVIPRHPVVPKPHALLSAIPVACQYFSVVDLCNAFLRILRGKIDRKCPFAFT